MIVDSLKTSLIDSSLKSNESFQHKLLVNSKNKKILTDIIYHLDNCDEFIFNVAFITLGGITSILESLRKLENKNIKGKILTGSYLNFTEPKALEKLQQFKNIEVKFCNNNHHSKGFFFKQENIWHIIIGSSNLTQSALTINQEYNIKFSTLEDGDIFKQIFNNFDEIYRQSYFLNEILDEYKTIYNKNIKHNKKISIKQNIQIKPNYMQEEALKNLQNLRENNQNKALLISATGTGKTILSALDVKNVNPKRCLFIVHRVNIAEQAKQTFEKIINNKTFGLYYGNEKENTEYIFATVQTLSNPKILNTFSKNEFDYIIIDEVHHVQSKSYLKIIDYFEPKFLLGMTATPERSDDLDIFKLFDYNICYEIRLHQALELNLLCPFHYFAIEDFYIDYEKSDIKNFSKLVSDERVSHIIEKSNFYGFSGEKRIGLIFVSNINEAKELANKLTKKGIYSKALTSQNTESQRNDTIKELEFGKLEFIITVDIFNEGIDIPSVNQVLLLRPTQSSIIYIQQLGRGLRKSKNKSFVVILDFVANYDSNFLIPIALSQDNSYDKDTLKNFISSPTEVIYGKSTITFTEIAKDLIYKNIQKTNFTQLKNIKKDYFQLKKELGKIPKLIDFEKKNFISPEILLNWKPTYYDILKTLKEPIKDLNGKEYLFLKFISKEFTPAKRLYEILILEAIYLNKDISKHLIKNITKFDINSYKNALKHLENNIFKVNAGRNEYFPLIQKTNQNCKLSLEFKTPIFKEMFEDLIEYNKIFYQKKYQQNIQENNLSLYNKYSKKDIAHILNYDYSNGGVNLSGYRFIENDSRVLLYITLDENKKFASYDNKFYSKKEFIFYSKDNKTLNFKKPNNETKLAQNKYNEVCVFMRVNRIDDYYYLGLVDKCTNHEESIKSNSKKIIKYTFTLRNNISDYIWNYFKSIQKKKDN